MIQVIIMEPDRMVRRILEETVYTIEGFQIRGMAECIEELTADFSGLLLGEVQCKDGLLCDWLDEQRRLNVLIDLIPVTGNHEYAMYKRCVNAGAIDYILKPFDTERLRRALVRYRRWKMAMMPDTKMEQTRLDAFYYPGILQEETGISQHTYERIYNYILECKNGSFTAREAALEMKMSPVTMRRYLEHMRQKGYLQVIPKYGKVGRPIYQYYADHSNDKGGAL